MKKLFLIFLVLFSSLLSIHAFASECSGGDRLAWALESGESMYLISGTYTSANSGPIGKLSLYVNQDMDCKGDYMSGLDSVSQMIITLNSGLYCKNSDTIGIEQTVGFEWKLTGLICEGNSIRSRTERSGFGPEANIRWSAGTLLGSATLQLTDDYWKRYTQDYRVDNAITPGLGQGSLVRSPNTNITSVIGNRRLIKIYNNGTCTMSLSTENVNFGKITPNDIKNGTVSRDFIVNYTCLNKAIAANGLILRFSPEHINNASEGTFNATDKNSHNLIFKLSSPSRNADKIPLNSNWVLLNATPDNRFGNATFRIQVMPSTPLPLGPVSTYLNVTLSYR